MEYLLTGTKEDSAIESIIEQIENTRDANFVPFEFMGDAENGNYGNGGFQGDYYQDNVLPGDIEISDSGLLLKKYITWEGFGEHHIKVYDNWLKTSASSNISARMLTIPDSRNPNNTKYVTFENLRQLPARYSKEGKELPLTPKFSRENGITYGCDWYIDLVMRVGSITAPPVERKENIAIGHIPLMLKSRNCILHGKTRRELAAMGEDPNDPGGYFIIGGAEKVVLLQEQLVVNRILLMNMDTKGNVVARMTASTPRGTSLIELGLDKETKSIIQIRFPSMKTKKKQGNVKEDSYKSVNVLRIFRIFGINTLEGIESLLKIFIKPERVKKCLLKLTRSIVDFTLIEDDIELMANEMEKYDLTREQKTAEVLKVLDNDLFPHLNFLPGPDGETSEERRSRIATSKVYLLTIMTVQYLEHMAGYREVVDRDSWSLKRIEGAGRMMEQLLRTAWGVVLGIVQGQIDSGTVKDLNGVAEKIKYNVITDTFFDSFNTANWGVKGRKIKTNIAQTLVREGVVATFAHINTVDVGVSRTDRQPSLRLVQNSQWGFICPVSTPEGANCGILKNVAITAKVSLEHSDSEILRFIIGDKTIGFEPYVTDGPYNIEGWTDKVMVNGKFLGWGNGKELKDLLIDKRRKNEILPEDVSVIYDDEDETLHVDMGPSRLVRPVLIVNPETQKLLIDEIKVDPRTKNIVSNEDENGISVRHLSPHDWQATGAMEFISSWEQEYTKIAPTTKHIEERKIAIETAQNTLREAKLDYERILRGEMLYEDEDHTIQITLEDAKHRMEDAEMAETKALAKKPYTHCEIDPQVILSVAAAIIPWPNHNQAPRNAYQVSMGKQALGIYHANHNNRYDGKTKLLCFPTRPMVETEMYDIIGLSERPAGENVLVAFMAYPYTEEDAFIFKKEFLENGGFRIMKYITYKTIVKMGDVTEFLDKPNLQGTSPERYKYIQSGPTNLKGLPMIGAPLKQGDCVIGKIQHVKETGGVRNESIWLRIGDEGVVDKVSVSTNGKTTTVKVKLRIMRIPQEGDKFAPRNAQKGTIGWVASDIDLPSTEDGLVPDIIVNVHCIPSRMTLSYFMEMIGAKYGAMKALRINGSAFTFKSSNLGEYSKTLKGYGMDKLGYEHMRSGTTGKKLEAKVFCAPVYVQALKHHVKDKIQARSQGQFKPQTHQPPRGRGNAGGLRAGEMERDAFISHGATSLLRERLMKASDAYQTVFCKRCGQFAVNKTELKLFQCKLCGDLGSFGRCTIPYAYKLLIHLLAVVGINLHPEFVDPEEYKRLVFNARNRQSQVSGLDVLRDELDELQDDLENFEDELDEFPEDGEDTEYTMFDD